MTELQFNLKNKKEVHWLRRYKSPGIADFRGSYLGLPSPLDQFILWFPVEARRVSRCFHFSLFRAYLSSQAAPDIHPYLPPILAGNRLSFSNSSKKPCYSVILDLLGTHCIAYRSLTSVARGIPCFVWLSWHQVHSCAPGNGGDPHQSTWVGSVGALPLKGTQRLVSGRWKVAVRVSTGTMVELESQRRPLVVNEYSFQCIMLPLFFCPCYAIKNSSFYINFLLNSFHVPMAIPCLPLSPSLPLPSRQLQAVILIFCSSQQGTSFSLPIIPIYALVLSHIRSARYRLHCKET